MSLVVTGGKANSGTALTVTPNPAAAGASVTLSATVTGDTPTGNISFSDGGTVLGSYPITAGAGPYNSITFSLSTSSLAAGTHNLTASYAGDANNTASVSSAVSLTVTGGKTTSATSLSASPNPATVGKTVTLTANVTGSSPAGTVTFLDGAKTLGTGTIAAGKASFSTKTLAKGTHSLGASYGGDTQNTGSSSSVFSLTVQ